MDLSSDLVSVPITEGPSVVVKAALKAGNTIFGITTKVNLAVTTFTKQDTEKVMITGFQPTETCSDRRNIC